MSYQPVTKFAFPVNEIASAVLPNFVLDCTPVWEDLF
jgi:hypothetical protein